jgi:hypothetical protein
MILRREALFVVQSLTQPDGSCGSGAEIAS